MAVAPPTDGGAAAPGLLGSLGVLRLTTCGAVDDGKSTLVGRLLADAGMLFDDQLAALKRASEARHGPGVIDYALLFDGLDIEREQSITIDVAYRFFMTRRRKFIIADAPGHEAHTRNMATAASHADLAIIVVDATRGPTPQTLRHLRIAGLVGVSEAIIAVSKMDAAGFSADRFSALSQDLSLACAEAGLRVRAAVPVAAVEGHNVVHRSAAMPWYGGPTLLEALETADPGRSLIDGPFRMPVQLVIRGGRDRPWRGYAGTVASGRIAVGSEVLIAHYGRTAKVVRIITADGDLDTAQAGQALTLELEGDHDISRGDLLAGADAAPAVTSRFEADVIGFSPEGLSAGRRVEVRMAARTVAGALTAIGPGLDFGDGAGREGVLGLNGVARCTVELSRPIALDRFADNRTTGSFLLVDRHTAETLAAGMVAVVTDTNVRQENSTINRASRRSLKGHGAAALWFTGLPGAGKSTIADLVQQSLQDRGAHAYALDGDNLRSGLNKDLGFTMEARAENVRRAAEVARLFVDAGLIVTCALVSPYRMERETIRDLFAEGEFFEVFVDAPLAVCMERDPKGLYRRAQAGAMKDLTGLQSPYEVPQSPDLHLRTADETSQRSAARVIAFLQDRGILW